MSLRRRRQGENMEIQKKLFELQDKEYAEFQSKLTPGIPRDAFIGVRVPEVRKLAKSYSKDPECQEFLKELPHLMIIMKKTTFMVLCCLCFILKI